MIPLKANAEEFSKNGDQFLGRVYKNNDFDCQDFVEKTMRTVGIKENLPGSNAWYRKMTWVGTPEECKRKFGSIPKGALLFILSGNGGEPEKYKSDGIGNASHIGIYTGRTGRQMTEHAKEQGNAGADAFNCGDGAIHSSASRGHVCTSKFAGKTINGGWNRIGLWDRFDYGDRINTLLNPSGEKEVTVIVEYAKVKDGALNLRSEKSTSSERLTQIPSGATVGVVERGDEWCKVIYNAYTGYAMTRFLDFEDNSEKNGNISITMTKDCALALYEALKSSLNK